jgi:hypothetical protein
MNDLERQLIFLYTVIAVVLVIFFMLIFFRKEMKKWSFVMWIFAILFIFPMGCIGLFFMFVTTYSFAEAIIKDDFVLTQIIANWFNIWLVYLIITNIKMRK